MGSAIADGVDIGQAGAAIFIDIDTVRTCCTRCDQCAHRRNDADADHDQVAGDVLAAGQCDPGHPRTVAHNRVQRTFEPHVDPVPAMLLGKECGQVLACHARKQPRQGFKQRHFAIEFGQHGGRFQPDVATADDDYARLGSTFGQTGKVSHQRVDIALVANGMNAGKVAAGA